MSETHLSFALKAPQYPAFASRPLIGWIAGVNLARLGQVSPKVFDGATGAAHEERAVVMHLDLPESKMAEVSILNIFEPGDGDAIRFTETGFSATRALAGGREVDFAEYLEEQKVDTRMPLVADYSGARINTSFQKVDCEGHRVDFYAPVFEGFEYRVARRVDDYVKRFTERIPKDLRGDVLFSCNCILNYLYSELEGKKTSGFVGPITFGEVAYQLVNQTLVYLAVLDAKA